VWPPHDDPTRSRGAPGRPAVPSEGLPPSDNERQAVLAWLRNPWAAATTTRPMQWLCPLLRDVFNPFATPLPNGFRSWGSGIVGRLAEAA
jgi:hypothetical protein